MNSKTSVQQGPSPVADQLNDIVQRCSPFVEDWDGTNIADEHYAISSMSACIERVAVDGSTYRRQAQDCLKRLDLDGHGSNFPVAAGLLGILRAMADSYDAGYVSSIQELVVSEVFSDMTDAAEHLLEQGYKDPAAMTAGAVLEQHLNKLCKKNGIPVVASKSPGQTPKQLMLDALNTELYKLKVYAGPTFKQIGSMVAIRNAAAHGKWDEYSAEQVQVMISSLRHTIMAHPA